MKSLEFARSDDEDRNEALDLEISDDLDEGNCKELDLDDESSEETDDDDVEALVHAIHGESSENEV